MTSVNNIDVFKITAVPSFISPFSPSSWRSFSECTANLQAHAEVTKTLLKMLQSNPAADPSVITDITCKLDSFDGFKVMDLKSRVTDLQSKQNRLIDLKTHQTRNWIIGASLVVLCAAAIVGLIFTPPAALMLVTLRVEYIAFIVAAIATGIFGVGIIVGQLYLPNKLKTEMDEQIPILQKDILAAANYLQENLTTIIEKLKKTIENRDQQLPQPFAQMDTAPTCEEIQKEIATRRAIKDEIPYLKAILRELEGPGQAMLQQVIPTAHPDYTTYTY